MCNISNLFKKKEESCESVSPFLNSPSEEKSKIGKHYYITDISLRRHSVEHLHLMWPHYLKIQYKNENKNTIVNT